MRQISSMSLYFLTKELKQIEGSRIDKISNYEKTLIFELYTKNGKQYLIIHPQLIYLTTQKPETTELKGFAEYLRKKLKNARIQKIEQINFERILKLEITTKEETYQLIIELFPPGNTILIKNKKIKSALHYPKYKDRTLRPNIQYELPVPKINTLKLKEEEIKKIIKESDKELVKTLAINLGLGGKWAEEILKRGTNIYKEIQKIKKEKIAPNTNKKEAYPIQFLTQKPEKKFNTISQAIQSVIEIPKKISQKQKQLQKFQTILQNQKETIKNLQKSITENKKKADLIYENYQKIEEIIKNNKNKNKTTIKINL